MLAVPPALLELLELGVGAKVDIDVQNGRPPVLCRLLTARQPFVQQRC